MTRSGKRIAVIGGWHQAAVFSACLSDIGHRVTGITDDPAVVDRFNHGAPPIYEPGLEELLKRNLQAGRLEYTTNYSAGLRDADFALLSIDTPVGPDDESDLSPIFSTGDQLATHVHGPLVLGIGAQVPVGTCEVLRDRIAALRPEYTIPVVYVPEFLRLGTALQTFFEADRFVIGADDQAVARRVAAIYEPLGRPIYLTTLRSAEMAKHASNAFLATSVSFINEIADLCEAVGADVTQVSAIMKLDRRIGSAAFLNAGIGYAGGTLGREIRALQGLGTLNQVPTRILDSVNVVNSERLERVLRRLSQIHATLRGLRITVVGLTYKPGTSTLRRSAALGLIQLLQARGASVATFDPLAEIRELMQPPSFEVSNDPVAAATGASALILLAPWPGQNGDGLAACARVMRHAAFIDTGNFMSPVQMAAAGFHYFGTGR